MNIKQVIAVTICIILCISISCKRATKDSDRSQGVVDAFASKIKNFTQEYFSLKYIYLTSESHSDSLKLSDYFGSSVSKDSLFNQIIPERQSGKASTFKYLKSFTTTNVLDSTIIRIGDTIKYVVEVTFELETNARDIDTDSLIIVRGQELHRVNVTVQNGKFKIVNDWLYNPVGTKRESQFEGGLPEIEESVPLFSYNPSAAVSWARTYWKTPPSTGYYDYTSLGGDCTNFISHALKTGGWKMVNEWHWLRDGMSCDYNMSTCDRSPAWTGAHAFNGYVKGAGSSRVTLRVDGLEIPKLYWDDDDYKAINMLNKGDIIQLGNSDSPSVISHSMIVTQKSATEPFIFVAYRNSDCALCSGVYEARPIKDFTLFNSGSSGKFYGYSIK